MTATAMPLHLPRPIDASWRSAILATAALWTFILIIYLPIIIDRNHAETWGVILDSSTILVSMLLALPLFELLKRTDALPPFTRVVVLLGGVVVAAAAQTVFDFVFTRLVATHLLPSWGEIPQSMARSYGALFNYVCVFGTNIVLFNLILSRRGVRLQERALAEAKAEAQLAQLTALRLQINPHFLFNTLNAISSLILTRRNEQAEAVTSKLSSFLRASLAADPQALVTLADEMQIIGDYLDIESVRFGARLEPVLECTSEAEQALIPGFLLQPLVENAVKYGVAPSRQPVRIRVAAEISDGELVLCVEDDGSCDRNDIVQAGTGTGLRNVRQRLATLYGGRARLSAGRREGCFVACVRMPAEYGG